MRKFLAAIALAFVLGACAIVPQTPQQQLAAVELAFTGVVEQLIVARNTGLIPDTAVWRCAQTIARGIDGVLDAAHKYMADGRSIAIILGTAQGQLQDLRRIHAMGENVCVSARSNSTRFRRTPDGHEVGQHVQRDYEDDATGRTYGAYTRGVGAYHIAA